MRIKELDGLRGFAVLAVLLHHFLPWAPVTGAGYGWLGVDLFFILSGYLITNILLDLRFQPNYFTTFYGRRAIRIFPPYLLGLVIYIIYSLISGLHGNWNLWLQYIFYYTSLYLGQPKELFANPAVVPPAVSAGLAVLWSLSVEEIFYTIWAPIIRYFKKPVLALTLFLMIVLPPFLRWYFHTPKFPEIFTFYCRMDGLAYGALVAFSVRRRNANLAASKMQDKVISISTFLLLSVSVAYWLALRGIRSSVWITSVGLVLADLSFALVVYNLIRFSNTDHWWVKLFRSKWLRSIGMVSYSLYLFHYPIRVLTADWVASFHISRQAGAVAAVLIGVPISFAIAYGLWYGMESRILKWKDILVPTKGHGSQPIQAANLVSETSIQSR